MLMCFGEALPLQIVSLYSNFFWDTKTSIASSVVAI
jgi:hypothetical protein